MARAASAVLLTAAVLIAGCSRKPPAPPAAGANVLLVTVDTLRADRFDAARMPRLHALGAEGLVYEEALSSVPLTLPAHCTILSGREPLHHGVRDNGAAALPSDVPTLATLLKGRGYATGAFVGAYVLDRRFGLARGFDEYDDHVERLAEGSSVLESERRAEVVVAAATAWIARQDVPFFAWVHVYDPHAPYDPPSPFREQHAGRPYDGEVAYADHWLGRLVDAARGRSSAGLLLAVTGDHGEGLGDHGERTHGLFVYQSTLRVPFVLAGPGIPRGERRRGPARAVDLVPTVLGRLGVPAPPGDGVDLLGPSAAQGEAYAETLYPETFGWAGLRSYRDRHLKLVDAPRPELYDVLSDPAEAHDLAAARPADVDRLRRALAAARQGERTATGGPVDPEAAERLRALGYAAGGPPASPAAGSRRDPKDALPLWQSFEAAMDAQGQGRTRDAVALLRDLAARDPGNGTFQRTLASALRRQGSQAEAAHVLGALVETAPGDAHAWHDRSVALAAVGRVDEAVQAEDRALRLDPGLAEAHNHRGILEAGRNRPAEALRSFEAASAVDPNNARAWSNRGNALRALGRLAEAEAAYRRAAELAPRDADPLNGLGVIAVQRGDMAEAGRLLKAALEREPGQADASLNLAFVEIRLGDQGSARRRLQLLLKAGPPPEIAARARRLLAEIG
jgi:arylsulfatase A-like enzyme/Flp pilus assembly protein TadD